MKPESSTVVSEDQNQPPAGWVLVNLRIFVGLLGAVACFAWLFLSLGTSAYFPFANAGGLEMGVGHVTFLVGSCLAFLATRVFTDQLQANKVTQCLLSALLTLAGLAGLWAYNYMAVGQTVPLWISACLLGMGFGFLYSLYGEFVCLYFYEYVKPYVHGIFAGAVFLCCGLLLTGESMGLLFGSVFPVAAIGCYAVVLVSCKLAERPQVAKGESKKRHRIVWRSYLSTTTSGMAAGFALGVLLSTQEVQSVPYLLVGGGLLATCIFLLVDSLRENLVNETVTMRFFLPFSAVVVFPLLFAPDGVRFVFAVALLCASMLPTTCSLSAVCKHIVICDLSAIHAFSFGRLMSFVGIALGMGLAFLGFTPIAQSGMGELAPAVSVVAFMLLVIFSASFVMTEDNYPDEKRFRAAVKEAEDGEAPVLPGTPIRPISANGKLDAPGSETPSAARPNVFYAKCDVVAERYGLSRRQREVLVMLAKGRNADYITEKLVISPHTAKAHIYNVYQKVGVHSRPELMDLVESVEIEASEEV
ncbi:MAG: helix-turn-helix transcriptional regulator [Eggerthellaceae bacterium]|nr:helix-turn-helix transcriptional regulator [Eggerthellaceae bacterium]